MIICPHCGGENVEFIASGTEKGGRVPFQLWRCLSCRKVFKVYHRGTPKGGNE